MRAPKIWGFTFRPSDLRAVGRRRFVFQLTPTERPARRPASLPPVPAALLRRDRRH